MGKKELKFMRMKYKRVEGEVPEIDIYLEDADAPRADFIRMQQEEKKDYEYGILEEVVINAEGNEIVTVIDSFGTDKNLKKEEN